MIELTCPRCKKIWNYKGKKIAVKEYPQYTSCGRCYAPVKIPYSPKDIESGQTSNV